MMIDVPAQPDVPVEPETPDVDEPVVDIPDADVPMADVPQTGDKIPYLLTVAGLSLAGLILVLTTGKKKEEA